MRRPYIPEVGVADPIRGTGVGRGGVYVDSVSGVSTTGTGSSGVAPRLLRRVKRSLRDISSSLVVATSLRKREPPPPSVALLYAPELTLGLEPASFLTRSA